MRNIENIFYNYSNLESRENPSLSSELVAEIMLQALQSLEQVRQEIENRAKERALQLAETGLEEEALTQSVRKNMFTKKNLDSAVDRIIVDEFELKTRKTICQLNIPD